MEGKVDKRFGPLPLRKWIPLFGIFLRKIAHYLLPLRKWIPQFVEKKEKGPQRIALGAGVVRGLATSRCAAGWLGR